MAEILLDPNVEVAICPGPGCVLIEALEAPESLRDLFDLQKTVAFLIFIGP